MKKHLLLIPLFFLIALNAANADELATLSAEKAVNPPIVETVMIGAESQQGISFTSRGQVIAAGN